jgi:A/G-specific adenine glycosylase
VPAAAADVQQRLLGWYAANARDLPWRRTHDPYAILVAEVMLQQTQVDRVIPRWHAWLRRFPTLTSLAEASRGDAIRAWHGLGYNLRAVRLHQIAVQVMAEFGGDLPRDLDGLLRLKGVGRYTAGAVACFAYLQPLSMVDTNVRRVLSRVFGIEPGEVERMADAVLPVEDAYPWNQALMDLGATVCRVRAPLCLACPLVGVCGGPTAAPRRRAAAAPGAPFRGSTRYYRGRLIDTLRTLGPSQFEDISTVVERVADPSDVERATALVHRLVADGLLTVDDSRQRVRLAD